MSSPAQEPVIGVELDFEFDKSEELCRAIEHAYEDVYGVLDAWKKEFQSSKLLSDSMYFSDFLAKREEYFMDTNDKDHGLLNMDSFFEWMDKNDFGGRAYTSLQHSTQTDALAKDKIEVTVNVFQKRAQSSIKEDNALSSLMSSPKAPVSVNIPSKHGTAPSQLLQRLNRHSRTLAYDYDNIFEHFSENNEDFISGDDVESDGEEMDVEALRRQHHERLLRGAEEGEDEAKAVAEFPFDPQELHQYTGDSAKQGIAASNSLSIPGEEGSQEQYYSDPDYSSPPESSYDDYTSDYDR